MFPQSCMKMRSGESLFLLLFCHCTPYSWQDKAPACFLFALGRLLCCFLKWLRVLFAAEGLKSCLVLLWGKFEKSALKKQSSDASEWLWQVIPGCCRSCWKAPCSAKVLFIVQRGFRPPQDGLSLDAPAWKMDQKHPVTQFSVEPSSTINTLKAFFWMLSWPRQRPRRRELLVAACRCLCADSVFDKN